MDEQRMRDYERLVATNAIHGFLSRLKSITLIWRSKTEVTLTQDSAEDENFSRNLKISGPLLLELNEHRIERDRLEAALAQLEAWNKEHEQIHNALSRAATKYRMELRDLSVERERAFLELENAYRLACASLGKTAGGQNAATSVMA